MTGICLEVYRRLADARSVYSCILKQCDGAKAHPHLLWFDQVARHREATRDRLAVAARQEFQRYGWHDFPQHAHIGPATLVSADLMDAQCQEGLVRLCRRHATWKRASPYRVEHDAPRQAAALADDGTLLTGHC